MRLVRALLLILVILAAWDLGWWYVAGVKPVAPWTLKAELASDFPPTVIDVRSPAEYEWFHIPGAINVPFPASLAELALAQPDPNKPIVVTCMTGHRSPPVVRQLTKGGYTNVRNLTWGMAAWKLFGGATVKGTSSGE